METTARTEFTVTCGGATHRLTYRGGSVLDLHDHAADVAHAERAIAAMGGEPPECLRVEQGLRTLLEGSNVLDETAALRFHERYGASSSPDPHWSPPAESLLRLPRQVLRVLVVDAARAALAEDDEDERGRVSDVIAAVAAAAIEPGVPGVAGGIGVNVRFTEDEPALTEAWAWNDGNGARLRVVLPWTWLFDVWGAGFAIVDDHFVASTDGLRFLVLHWGRARRSDPHDWTGKLVWRRAARSPSGEWQLR